MKSVIHRSSKAISAALSLGLASAGAAVAGSLFGVSKGPTPNKYNPVKGNSAEITRHNAAIDAARVEPKLSKAKRKKLAAGDRKRINVLANGGEYRGVQYRG